MVFYCPAPPARAERTVRIRACAVCLSGESVLLILLRDPVTGRHFFSFPGGRIETGESSREAAVRETAEETGYVIELAAQEALVMDYDYLWGGKSVHCLTHFFLAHPVGRTSFQPETIICGHQWVALKDCVQSLEEVFLRVITHFFDDVS